MMDSAMGRKNPGRHQLKVIRHRLFRDRAFAALNSGLVSADDSGAKLTKPGRIPN